METQVTNQETEKQEETQEKLFGDSHTGLIPEAAFRVGEFTDSELMLADL